MPQFKMEMSLRSRSIVENDSFFAKRRQHLSIPKDQEEFLQRKRTMENQQTAFDAESFSTEFAHKLSISNRSMLEGSVVSHLVNETHVSP